MPRKNPTVSNKAWRLLRLALLWTRKGGLFKRRLIMELRVVPKFFKNVGGHIGSHRKDQIGYKGEYELSFDKTPVVHVKMHRPGSSMRFLVPHIPCINPEIDFDYDFDEDAGDGCYDAMRKSFIEDGRIEYDDAESDEDSNEAGKEIDLRAEEFITKFYEQMKLQRQISYLEYSQ